MRRRAYEIAWSPTARRDLRRLPEKIAAAAVEFLYGAVADNPQRVATPLKLGLEGLYSARRGDHRILYSIDEEARVVHVVTIEHRSDVYRRRP